MRELDLVNVLNEGEANTLNRIADDEVAMEALRKVLLFGIYQSGVLEKDKPAEPINFAFHFGFNREDLTNEKIGELLRAACEGLKYVEQGLAKVASFKTKPKEEKVVNLDPR